MSISADGKFHLWVRHYPVFIDRFYDRRLCRYIREYLEYLERDGSRGFIPYHLLHDRPEPTTEACEEKAHHYTQLRRITREQSGPPPGLLRRLRAKWANFIFYTAAFSGRLRTYHKRPAYCFFLFRWYAVFLFPPLRVLTRHDSPAAETDASPVKKSCSSAHR